MKLFENKYNLSVTELQNLNKLYEANKVAEYILENYYISESNNVEKAIELGYNVRAFMEQFETSEEEAINVIMKDYRNNTED